MLLSFDGPWGYLQLEVLDISRTSIPLSSELCTANVSLFASRPVVKVSEAQLGTVVRQCSKNADLLDVSATNAATIHHALSDVFEALSSDDDGHQLSFRLQTTDSPVDCSLRQGVRWHDGRGKLASLSSQFSVLEYQCHCSAGYPPGSDGVCRKLWTNIRIAGLVTGVAVLAVILTSASTVSCILLRRRRRWLANDLNLHKGLLEESVNDVMALQRAWEIDWAEVELSTRIDQGAEGAFGEVRVPSPCFPAPLPGRNCSCQANLIRSFCGRCGAEHGIASTSRSRCCGAAC